MDLVCFLISFFKAQTHANVVISRSLAQKIRLRALRVIFVELFQNEILWRSLIGNIWSRLYWRTTTGIAYIKCYYEFHLKKHI